MFLMYRLLVVLLLVQTGVSHAQVKGKDLVEYNARNGTGVNDANFFQDERMNYYDIKHLQLDITVQPKSIFITSTCNYTVLVEQPLDTFIIEFKETMQLDSAFIN